MHTTTETTAPNRAPLPPVKRLAPIDKIPELYPNSFTKAATRDLKFRAFDRTNSRGETIKGNGTGPAGVWIQIGRKVLVDLDAFEAWIDSHRGQ